MLLCKWTVSIVQGPVLKLLGRNHIFLYSLQLDFLFFPCYLTRFPCSARRSRYTSLLRMWCSVLDFSDVGRSAAGGWSCMHKYNDRVINKHSQMFKAKNRPRVTASPCQPSCLCVRPHLEFQCIEGVFRGAAEWPLTDHLHGVEQLVAVSPQRTSHL